jgi:hypothetical protein
VLLSDLDAEENQARPKLVASPPVLVVAAARHGLPTTARLVLRNAGAGQVQERLL